MCVGHMFIIVLTYLLTKMQVNVCLCCKLNKLAMIMNGQWMATSLHVRSVREHSCRCQGPDTGSACHLMALIDTTCDGHLERLKLPIYVQNRAHSDSKSRVYGSTATVDLYNDELFFASRHHVQRAAFSTRHIVHDTYTSRHTLKQLHRTEP